MSEIVLLNCSFENFNNSSCISKGFYCRFDDLEFSCPQKSPDSVQLSPTKDIASGDEIFLWTLSSKLIADSKSQQYCSDYYVPKLVPPLSPCGNKFGENLRRLSQIPGRSHSFQISTSPTVEFLIIVYNKFVLHTLVMF